MKRCPKCGFREPLGKPKARSKTWRKRMESRDGHEYLHGVLAHTKRRLEIYRNAGGEATWFDETDPASVEDIKAATCQGCVEAHLVGWAEGQWHHNVKSHGGKRCDCAACGLFLCPAIHEQFRNKVIAVKELER